jgi:hypothetical protein
MWTIYFQSNKTRMKLGMGKELREKIAYSDAAHQGA